MATIRRTTTLDGVLTNVTSMVLADPDNEYGVRRTDTEEVVVAAGTAMTNVSAGTYEHTFTDVAGVEYAVCIKRVYGGQTKYSKILFTATGPTDAGGLDTSIYGLLSGSVAVVALVAGRISPIFDTTPGETRDRLVYQQVSGRRDYDCDGQGPAHGVYQITAWSPTHEGASALAEVVRSLLSGYAASGVMGVFVRDQGDVPSLDPDETARQYGKYIEVELIQKES